MSHQTIKLKAYSHHLSPVHEGESAKATPQIRRLSRSKHNSIQNVPFHKGSTRFSSKTHTTRLIRSRNSRYVDWETANRLSVSSSAFPTASAFQAPGAALRSPHQRSRRRGVFRRVFGGAIGSRGVAPAQNKARTSLGSIRLALLSRRIAVRRIAEELLKSQLAWLIVTLYWCRCSVQMSQHIQNSG